MTFRALRHRQIHVLYRACRHRERHPHRRTTARPPDTTDELHVLRKFFRRKLLEAKHLGKGTFTDVGTTYKLCRNSALRALLPVLNPAIDLEFNAHFLDTALSGPFHIVECPITFHDRVGSQQGRQPSNRRAFAVGMRMIRGIVLGWRSA